MELFEAFQLLFNTNRGVGIEFDKYMQFSVSSKKDIQSVINFFSHGPVSLIGYKQTPPPAWGPMAHGSRGRTISGLDTIS